MFKGALKWLSWRKIPNKIFYFRGLWKLKFLPCDPERISSYLLPWRLVDNNLSLPRDYGVMDRTVDGLNWLPTIN